MNVVYSKFALVCYQILVFATSVNAVDFDLINVANRDDNKKDDTNLINIYNDKWNSHYERHNIIEVLKLNKGKYAESIENIRKIGLSSVQNYVNYANGKMHHIYVLGENPEDVMDALIVTNMDKSEDILDYLMRQEVENLNYILLENLMMRFCVSVTICDTNELLNVLTNKIKKKLDGIKNKEILKKVITKLNKSANDVKTYVEAGALNEFMKLCLDYQENNDDFEDDHSDNKYEKRNEELQNSSEQDIQNSVDEWEEDKHIDVNTEEGKKIATNLITNIYKLAEIYELATIVALEFNDTGDLAAAYTYELDEKGKLAKICELFGTGELVEVDKSEKIYESATEKGQSLYFSSKNEVQLLLQIAQQAKNALNEFEKKVNGGTTSRELMRALRLTVLSRDDEDYPSEKQVDEQDYSMVIPVELDMLRIWGLLKRFKGQITNDWFAVNIKVALVKLKPHLESYLTNEGYQIVEDEEDEEDM